MFLELGSRCRGAAASRRTMAYVGMWDYMLLGLHALCPIVVMLESEAEYVTNCKSHLISSALTQEAHLNGAAVRQT